MARMTGGEAVLEALAAQGIDTLFVLPGVQNDAFFNALHDAGERLRWVVTRHEQGAGYMAYGYAAATGRPGAYCVVPGPGFLNTTAALATAYAASAPVFCLSGQIPSRHIGRGVGLLHELPDQLGIMRRLTKWAARIDAPQDAARLVAEAFAQMASGRPRPTALEMPMDVMAREAWVTPGRVDIPAARPPEPDPEALARAAELLNGAKRPMIFVGGGAAGASPLVRALALRLGAPVVARWMGRGVMDDRSPLSISLTAAHRLWPEVDVALAVGSRFQRVQMDWGLDNRLKVIRIDLDPTEIARHARPEVALLADAGEALEALLPQIGAADRAGWRERVATVKDEVWALYRRELAPQLGWIEAIRAALPEDGILVEDLTQIGYVSRIAFPVYGPRQYVSSGYQGTLGMSLPVALGAKVACPKRPVVAIAGDGGFMYNVQELATAVQHGIGVVAVVFDDGAYGNVRRMQRQLYGNRIIASDLRNPDFVQLASSFDLIARAIIMSGAYEHNWKKHPVVHDRFAVWQNRLPLFNMRMNNLSAAVLRPQIQEVSRRARDGRANHDYVAGILNGSPWLNVPPQLAPELRAPDSIQFNLCGFGSDEEASAFQRSANEKGMSVQIFGLSEDNARAFWNWNFIGPQSDLKQTRAMLMRACDVRLPARLTKDELDFIATALVESADDVKRARRALRPRLSAA